MAINPSTVNRNTFMTTNVGKVLAEAHERRIDILAIGDSNQAFGGTGWDHGMQLALSKTFGLYATGILTTGENGGAGQALGFYAAGGDRDAAVAETGAPTVLDNYMDGNLFPQNYSYLAASTFTQGYGLFLTTPSTEDPFNVLNEDFKIHYCYGTFDTGAGSFTPGIRLEISPWTNYITRSPISTNKGVQGIAYTALKPGAGPRPNQIACRFGHVGTTVTAPYISYFWRAEIEAIKFGVSYSSIYSLGATSLYDMAAAFIAAHDNSILLNLSEARRLQESAGYTPKVIMMVNAGINDRNETSTPSLGPGAITDPDSAEAYVDNFKAIVARVEAVWNANFTDGEIYWMVVPSHPISDPDDVELVSYREAISEYAAGINNIDVADISTLTDFNEMTSRGWYDGGGEEHLTEIGYEEISKKIVNPLPGPTTGGIPNEYRATIYGDSYSDSGGGTGWIGQSLGTNTSVDFILREQATGGDLVSEIRTAFEADFPHNRDNLIILQGVINSIRTDVNLESIKEDWSAMADAVLATDNMDLLLVNQSPWGTVHAFWTPERQYITEQFNAWQKGKYGPYVADTYTALGDPAEPRQLADEFYKAARTDSHPSRNGDVVIDDTLGEKLYYANPTIPRSAVAGNSHPNPNTPADWSFNLRATVGGNLIRLCDGTYSNVNGIIPSSDSISHIARDGVGTPANNSDIEVRFLLKSGNHTWARVEYKDNAGALHNVFIDLNNIVLSTVVGTLTWTIAKAARGWVEVIGTGTNDTGATVNTVTVFPAEADGDINFVGDVRTPSLYVDRVQFIVT